MAWFDDQTIALPLAGCKEKEDVIQKQKFENRQIRSMVVQQRKDHPQLLVSRNGRCDIFLTRPAKRDGRENAMIGVETRI